MKKLAVLLSALWLALVPALATSPTLTGAGVAGVAVIDDITVTDDGDAAPSSGAGTATHTYATQTSTGPDSFVLMTWQSDAAPAEAVLTNATWNGNAMAILVSRKTSSAGEEIGTAIVSIAGAQSGSIVFTWDQNVADSQITKVSLDNVVSMTPVATDGSNDGGGAAVLDSLLAPGVGGVRLAAYSSVTDGTAITWSLGTELADIDAGTYRHGAAYHLANDGSSWIADGAADRESLSGVSIR